MAHKELMAHKALKVLMAHKAQSVQMELKEL
jgi:hypothetical protein